CTPSPEVCDGCDNDCDGDVDEGAPPAACGFPDPPQCLGTKPCIAKTAPGGYLQSIGKKVGECAPPPSYGACNATGTTETCNGITDDGLNDTPPDPGCWSSQATPCSQTCGYAGKAWCPPAGGTCTGLGTLKGACAVGHLVCQGTNGWVCKDDQGPTAEQCNGL